MPFSSFGEHVLLANTDEAPLDVMIQMRTSLVDTPGDTQATVLR